MKVESKKSRLKDVTDELLAVLVFQKEKLPTEVAQFAKGLTKEQFEGKLMQAYSTSTLGKSKAGRVLIIGLGEQKEFEPDFLRRAAGLAVRYCKGAKIASASIMVPEIKGQDVENLAGALTEGAILADYKFTNYKSDKKGIFNMVRMTLVSMKDGAARKGIARGMIMAGAQNFVRETDEQPANVMTPRKVAEVAKELAKRQKLHFKAYDEKEMKKMGMNALLAVGQGSEEPSRLVMLEYNKGRKLPLYVIVGKGVTFDSGGISLKPSKNMHEMKYDKSGAIVVLGIMKAVSELKLPIRLVGLMPCVENVPSGSAQKPGDIVAASNGKTIEVLNTDAEGRMILADALAFGAKMKPKAMIDLATLTGAMVVCLGSHAIGCFTNDDKLNSALENAGNATHERVWRLPIWKEYGEMIKAEFADIKNISETGQAGSITAAMFLKEFIGDTKWAHLDIAGVESMSAPHPYLDKGATGIGVRLVTETLSRLSK
ncbi:MAG: leucyl aminopeptidase [Candidatus Micrarchaeota archaeon]